MTKLEKIQEMESQLKALKAEVEAENKVEKWQPKGGEYVVQGNGLVISSSSSNAHIDFGCSYTSSAQAEKARDAMRSHNRLLAWLAENDDGWVADWNDVNQHKCYVYLANDGLYYISYNTSYKTLGAVYMSEANVDKLCKLLNEGVVEL